jgi:hypothetical protein
LELVRANCCKSFDVARTKAIHGNHNISVQLIVSC